MADSESSRSTTGSHLQGGGMHSFDFTSPLNHMKAPQVFTDSGGCTRSPVGGVRSNGGRVVNPKQFAPLSTNQRTSIPTTPAGYQDYNVPQTPPVSNTIGSQ